MNHTITGRGKQRDSRMNAVFAAESLAERQRLKGRHRFLSTFTHHFLVIYASNYQKKDTVRMSCDLTYQSLTREGRVEVFGVTRQQLEGSFHMTQGSFGHQIINVYLGHHVNPVKDHTVCQLSSDEGLNIMSSGCGSSGHINV